MIPSETKVESRFWGVKPLFFPSKNSKKSCSFESVTKKRATTPPGLYIFEFFSIYDYYQLHKYYRAHLPIDAKFCNNK